MDTAIYYPHTECDDKEFLKSALFLWDRLEFIVPYENYPIASDDPEVRETLEIIGHQIVPSTAAQKIAHNEILDFATSVLPDTLNLKVNEQISEFHVFPHKFLYETWTALQDLGLAQHYNMNDWVDKFVEQKFGLYMMSILAIACAGTVKKTITDQFDAYHSLYQSLADCPNDASNEQQLTPILTVPISALNLESISIQKLLGLRKNEDILLTELRKAYLSEVEVCMKQIGENADQREIIIEILHDFSTNMEHNLKELKCALRIQATKTILSKEIGVAVAGLALTTVEPFSGSILSSGALSRSLVEYRDKRRQLLKRHASAWYYVASSDIHLI